MWRLMLDHTEQTLSEFLILAVAQNAGLEEHILEKIGKSMTKMLIYTRARTHANLSA